jgi:rubrerythrin
MVKYRVRWEIEIEAGSPREAAGQAFAIHRDPNSIATVFQVVESTHSKERGGEIIDVVDLALERSGSNAGDDAGEDVSKFENFYRCPECEHEWEDTYTSIVEDDCPSCGNRHITPYQSEDA